MENGFLMPIVFPFIACLTQSGMILSKEKSPPPITLPALAVDIAKLESSEKKDFMYECVTSSEQLLEFE